MRPFRGSQMAVLALGPLPPAELTMTPPAAVPLFWQQSSRQPGGTSNARRPPGWPARTSTSRVAERVM